ncbi:prolipoprotein diacylglyceryl transferase [Iamia majanohamensis]|uniref:Prolipoprotein diacylglyceryl transferase n=1 Tax=Iamia majanohamensis TaxID=467976 RepID=A0AAF0BRI6_9ACTN|nr:prolipoprotein diacylglyceryl transferase family protein [Iamia majanohamensis]WCO66741.1 prolipoprotein diacylglyceryl transferase [Iamia majanohamensis]
MLSPVVAVIPYTTFPQIGPLQTFGLMVAVGVLLGIWFGAVHAEKYGMTRDETYRLGTRMVLAGVIGSRITWVLTHLDQIDSPIDVIAVWEGGLQFSGGFLAAIAVGLPTFLGWNRLQRWQLLDGFAVATVLGAAFGRIGCTAVGEHFGRQSDFFLAVRYDGGEVREQFLGLDAGAPRVEPGLTFHNTAIYEGLWLFLLFAVLWFVLDRVKPTPGTVGALFLVGYGVARFSFDSLRVNDERVLGLTGAQWMCLGMLPIAAYIWLRVRPANAAALAAGEVGGTPVAHTTTSETASGRSVTTTKRKKPAPARATGAGAASEEGDAAAGSDPDGAAAPDGDVDGEDVEVTDDAAADPSPGAEDPGDDPTRR